MKMEMFISQISTATFSHEVLRSRNVSCLLFSTMETKNKTLWVLWGLFNMGHLRTRSQNRPTEKDLAIKCHSDEIGDWFRPISPTNTGVKILNIDVKVLNKIITNRIHVKF